MMFPPEPAYGGPVSGPEKTARQIAEDLLARTGQGLITGDFNLFGDCFALPNTMNTFENRRVVNDLGELRVLFDDVRTYFAKVGMTEMARHIVDAEFRNATTIVSTHQSRLVAETELIQQPFDVLSVIEQIDDIWRIRHSEYAIVDSEDHNTALVGPNAGR